MALVKVDEPVIATKKDWNNRDKHATRHKIPEDVPRPAIDYDKLKALCNIQGLKDRNSDVSSEDAHRVFMENYKQMFVKEEPKKGMPIHSLSRSSLRSSESSLSSPSTSKSVAMGNSSYISNNSRDKKDKKGGGEEDTVSHDIRDHLATLHKQRRSENPQAVQADRIKTLRRLLKKLSFERTAAENEQIYNILQHFPLIAAQVQPNVLKELCVVTQIDVWKDPDITVFGNTGFHIILKGKVRPQSAPWVKLNGDGTEFRSPTPEPPQNIPELKVGSCFGTLEKVEGRESNSRILTAVTLEHCEFLKISTSDYKRVIEQLRQRDETEKVNLLQSCKAYQYWSKQPLVKVAYLLEWTSFPENTVLVSEGYEAPFAAVIKKGTCHVMRQVEVLVNTPSGKQEKKLKQVVMGSLHPHDSFGEISIIANQPISCSIITATPVELATIEPPKLDELDKTTVQLLQHSSEETFGHITSEDVHNEYVKQQMKREWNEFKHNVVVDVINSRGVRPGYGKWAKS